MQQYNEINNSNNYYNTVKKWTLYLRALKTVKNPSLKIITQSSR